MGNKKIYITAEGRLLLDEISSVLNISRPESVVFSLAKGLSITNGPSFVESYDMKNKWEFAENVIDGTEYLLFKHLIINEQGKQLNDAEVSKYIGHYVELGVREYSRLKKEKRSIEDLRLLLLETE